MLVNMVYALFPALVVFGAGLDPWLAALVWWVAYRFEFLYDAIHANTRVQAMRGDVERQMAQRAIDND